MNKFLIATLFISMLCLTSCEKEPEETDYSYTSTINSPNSDDKHVGESIHIHVVLESATGEPVHHAKIRIYNKADNTEIYNKPDAAHVHKTDGTYEFHDDFQLSNDNGVNPHTDWIIEAKVWGHDAEAGEVVETVEFHVHPE